MDVLTLETCRALNNEIKKLVHLYATIKMMHGPINISTLMQKPQSLQSNTTHEITQQINRKLLRMDVLTSKTCRALNNEIKKQVTSVGLSLFNYKPQNLRFLPLVWKV